MSRNLIQEISFLKNCSNMPHKDHPFNVFQNVCPDGKITTIPVMLVRVRKIISQILVEPARAVLEPFHFCTFSRISGIQIVHLVLGQPSVTVISGLTLPSEVRGYLYKNVVEVTSFTQRTKI